MDHPEIKREPGGRSSFDRVPELYDEIRPGYPHEVLHQIDEYARLTPSSRIIEVGPGTGQASQYFIDRGCALLGIELGADLAAYARQKYAGCPNAAFVHGAFETWAGEVGGFDLLLSAQAFHWIELSFGLANAARLLSSCGTVALMWNLDESQHTDFWRHSTAIHEEFFPKK